MPSKLRPSKGSVAKKVAGKALGLAANFVPGGGIAKSIVGGIASKIGAGGAKASGARRRRKGVTYYLKRIPVEKAKARLTRIKMSAYKGL